MAPGRANDRDADWAFGDAWKEGSPEDDGPSDADVIYVEVLRCDTGQGFDDSELLEMVGYLGSRGIRATYDSFSLGLEPAAIKTYVLKVEAGRAEEAIRRLRERTSGDDATE